MNPRVILFGAEEALLKGEDVGLVNIRIQKLSDGRFGSIEALREALNAPTPTEAAPDVPMGLSEAQARLSAGSGEGFMARYTDPLKDWSLQTVMGTTGNLLPDIMDLAGKVYPDNWYGREIPASPGGELRQRSQDLDLLAPTASMLSKLGGGFLLGGGTGKLAQQAVTRRTGSNVLGTLAGGGVGGGTATGVMATGATEGSPGERLAEGLRAVPQGAVWGTGAALTGLGLGAASRPIRNALSLGDAGRARRVTGMIREGTGIRQGIDEVNHSIETRLRAVRDKFYKPLDEAFDVVDDPRIIQWLDDAKGDKDVMSAVRAVSKEVGSGGRAPSFGDLQNIQRRLGKNMSTKNQGDELKGVMQDVFPGFKEGTEAWGAVQDVKKAVAKGRTAHNLDAGDIDTIIRNLSSGEEREAFRVGQVMETVSRLNKQNDEATGLIRQWMNVSGGQQATTRNTLRRMFPDDVSFQRFARDIVDERDAFEMMKSMRKWGMNIAKLALLGAGASYAGGLFSGG